MKLLFLCGTALLVAITRLSAATLYVDAASTNAVPPFTNWATAAVTIQDAVDAAVAGDEIVVTNGVYQTGARAVYGMSNRVAVTKPVTVRSVNGPEVTSIVGQGPIGDNAIRCVYLTNGAALSGFMLTNGATRTGSYAEMGSVSNSGGGVWCEAQRPVVTNCVLAGNSAHAFGGGAYSGTLNKCLLTGNSARDGGGVHASALNDCSLTDNKATSVPSHAHIGVGGGASASTLTNCTLTGNSAGGYGGGADSSTLANCIIMRNISEEGGGVSQSMLTKCIVSENTAYDFGGGGAVSSTMNNCIISSNSAEYGGGAYACALSNCTITGNSAVEFGGGVSGGTVNNCIVYFNSATPGPNWGQLGSFPIAINNSCTFPAPESGVGNITNAPRFVDTNGWSNLRLQPNSPCINAGNNAYVLYLKRLSAVFGSLEEGAW